MRKHLNSWAEKITEEVYQKWKEEYSYLSTGVKTFYTPVYESPPLLIIGDNPGGDEDSFEIDKERFKEGDFSPPTPAEHELIEEDYSLAREFRNKIFDERRDLLWKAVKFDMIFFRSPDKEGLKERLGKDYDEVKEYSYRKTQEILRKVNPEAILLYGIGVFSEFRDNIEGDFQEFREDEVKSPSRNMRIFRRGRWEGIDIYGIIHPTGVCNASNEELAIAKKKLFDRLY